MKQVYILDFSKLYEIEFTIITVLSHCIIINQNYAEIIFGIMLCYLLGTANKIHLTKIKANINM